ncbi:MAG: hypothetical protein RL625_660 [Gemmatimonadota bacterium]|jgi:uncharacterized protein
MLSFPIRELEHGAVQVAGDLAPVDPVWLEGDSRPVQGVRVTGRLSGAGSGRYYFSGALSGVASGECRRCLAPVEIAVQSDLQALFADASDENADEPDVLPLGEGGMSVDLRPAVREQWVLETAVLPLCRPDCLGFCPTCGADRNSGPCACTRS